MLASTQCGRYCSGPVRNRRTRSTIGEGKLGDLASRARPSAIAVCVGLAVDDESPADRRGCVRGRKAKDVGVFVDPLHSLPGSISR